jgi:L-asparagine oxygenase
MDQVAQSALEANGWANIQQSTGEGLLTLASSIGTPRPTRGLAAVPDILRPQRARDARRGSMSSVYGLSALPFHTDFAHHAVPPRYVLLRLAPGEPAGPKPAPTLLLDLSSLPLSAAEVNVISHDVWMVRGGYQRFYATLLSEGFSSSRRALRYDPCCMRPAWGMARRSQRLMEAAIRAGSPSTFRWSSGVVLILDNWRMLHARPAIPGADRSWRALERVLVD